MVSFLPLSAALFPFLVLAPAPASAQELPVLDPVATRWITQEVSGDAAFEHIRFMTTAPHRPRGGSNGLMYVAKYYEARAKALGLEDVKLIRQADVTRPWNAKLADLWLLTAEPEPLFGVLGEPGVSQTAPGAAVHQVEQEVGDADLDLVLEMHELPHLVDDLDDLADAEAPGLERR